MSSLHIHLTYRVKTHFFLDNVSRSNNRTVDNSFFSSNEADAEHEMIHAQRKEKYS